MIHLKVTYFFCFDIIVIFLLYFTNNIVAFGTCVRTRTKGICEIESTYSRSSLK